MRMVDGNFVTFTSPLKNQDLAGRMPSHDPVNCSNPLSNPISAEPELHRRVPGINRWFITRSQNPNFEEVYDIGIPVVPRNIRADGLWHKVVRGCYSYNLYFNDRTACCDLTGFVGTNTLQRLRYIVYGSCNGNTCDGKTIPTSITNNGRQVFSVLRVKYDLVTSCNGSIVLTEEQYYARNYGWIGFYNTLNNEQVQTKALVDAPSCILTSQSFCGPSSPPDCAGWSGCVQ